MNISRRGVLIGTGAIVGLCWIGAPVFASGTADTNAILSLLGDTAKAAAIGSTWVQQENQNLKPDDVMRDLTGSLQQQGWSGGDADELRAKYAIAVQADYRNGNVVKIQGWQIARTQAELCALAYFSTNGLL